MSGAGPCAAWDRALVVFSGGADLWWLRALHPGFRHCFVALSMGDRWVVVEPLSHRTEIAALDLPAGFDLAAWYAGRGLIVVESHPRPVPRRAAPWRPYSCVESVKRILGIQAAGILTPWQLFNFLRHEGKKVLTPPAE